MASGHVLRFPRSDSEGAFVIVQATPTRSKALDVKLVGTDGVEPYAVSREFPTSKFQTLVIPPSWPTITAARASGVLADTCFMRRTHPPHLIRKFGKKANGRVSLAVRHDKVASLRVKNSPVSEEEWVTILTAVLHQEPAEDVEAIASVENESVLTLTIRKKGNEFTVSFSSFQPFTYLRDGWPGWADGLGNLATARRHRVEPQPTRAH